MATKSKVFFLKKWRCLHIRSTAYCTSFQCIASHNTLWMRKYAERLQIQALPPNLACLSVCNTLRAFERLLIRFIYAGKKICWSSRPFSSQWPGMDGWRRPLLSHKWQLMLLWYDLSREFASFLNEWSSRNICDYITVVVTFGDFLISLQKISLDSRNNLFYFS